MPNGDYEETEDRFEEMKQTEPMMEMVLNEEDDLHQRQKRQQLQCEPLLPHQYHTNMDDELEIEPAESSGNGPAEQIERMLKYSLYRRSVLKQSASCNGSDEDEDAEVMEDDDEDDRMSMHTKLIANGPLMSIHDLIIAKSQSTNLDDHQSEHCATNR